MNELLHRASSLLSPVWTRLLDVIRSRDVVLADETRLRILKDASGKPKTGFVWTFGAADADGNYDVAYQFAASRSGSTPKALLEGTRGVLLVDGYTGYNGVEKVSSRRRAACLAHVRRYFFESLKTAPVAQEALVVTQTPRGPDSRSLQGVARRGAREASAKEPTRHRHPICARSVEGARRLPRGCACALGQQRVRARAPADHTANAIDALLPGAWATAI